MLRPRRCREDLREAGYLSLLPSTPGDVLPGVWRCARRSLPEVLLLRKGRHTRLLGPGFLEVIDRKGSTSVCSCLERPRREYWVSLDVVLVDLASC